MSHFLRTGRLIGALGLLLICFVSVTAVTAQSLLDTDPEFQRDMLQGMRQGEAGFSKRLSEFNQLLGENPAPGSSARVRLETLARDLHSEALTSKHQFDSVWTHPHLREELSRLGKPWEKFLNEQGETARALIQERAVREGRARQGPAVQEGEPAISKPTVRQKPPLAAKGSPTVRQGAPAGEPTLVQPRTPAAQEGTPTVRRGSPPAAEGAPAAGEDAARVKVLNYTINALEFTKCLKEKRSTDRREVLRDCLWESARGVAIGELVGAGIGAVALIGPTGAVLATVAVSGLASYAAYHGLVQIHEAALDLFDREKAAQAEQEAQEAEARALATRARLLDEYVIKLRTEINLRIVDVIARMGGAQNEVNTAAEEASKLAREANLQVSALEVAYQQQAQVAGTACAEAEKVKSEIEARAAKVVKNANTAGSGFEGARILVEKCEKREGVRAALELQEYARKVATVVLADFRKVQDGRNQLTTALEPAARLYVFVSRAEAEVNQIRDKVAQARPFEVRARGAADRFRALSRELETTKKELLAKIEQFRLNRLRETNRVVSGEVDQRLDPLIAQIQVAALTLKIPMVGPEVSQAARRLDEAQAALTRLKTLTLCRGMTLPRENIEEANAAISLMGVALDGSLPQKANACLARLDRPSPAAPATAPPPVPRDLLSEAEKEIRKQKAEDEKEKEQVEKEKIAREREQARQQAESQREEAERLARERAERQKEADRQRAAQAERERYPERQRERTEGGSRRSEINPLEAFTQGFTSAAEQIDQANRDREAERRRIERERQQEMQALARERQQAAGDRQREQALQQQLQLRQQQEQQRQQAEQRWQQQQQRERTELERARQRAQDQQGSARTPDFGRPQGARSDVDPRGGGQPQTSQPQGRILACNQSTKSGGQGVTRNRHELGSTPGRVTITYDMKPNPDSLQVFYQRRPIAGTGGRVSGTGRVSFDWRPVGSDYVVEVEVNGPGQGTQWNYTTSCPR